MSKPKPIQVEVCDTCGELWQLHTRRARRWDGDKLSVHVITKADCINILRNKSLGTVGPSGATGAQGPQGPPGAQGMAGPAGPRGLPGQGYGGIITTYHNPDGTISVTNGEL